MRFTILKCFVFFMSIKPRKCTEFTMEFVHSKYFIDKTDLLRKFFDTKQPQSCYVTAPRGFGKTSVLKMIDKFSNIEVDSKYNKKPSSETEAYKIFNKTNIAEDAITMRHLAKYPVIYLDLEFIIDKSSKIDEFFVTRMFQERLLECFKRYEWVMHLYKKKYAEEPEKNFTVSKTDIEFLEKAFHVKVDDPDFKYYKKLTHLEVERSLVELSTILYNHFDRSKVIILIDNVDTTFHQLYTIAHQDQVSELTFLSNTILIVMFNAFNGFNSEILKRSLSVGMSNLVLSIEPKEMSSNIVIYKFLDEPRNIFLPYMAFLQQDIDKLCQSYNCSAKDKKTLKANCNGYHTSLNRTPIYTPASTIAFFHPHQPVTGNTTRVTQYGQVINMFSKKSKEFKKHLSALLSGKSITFDLSADMNFQEFMELMQFEFENVYKAMLNAILTYCFDLGFITHAKTTKQFVAPNKEIKAYIKKVKTEPIPKTNRTIRKTRKDLAKFLCRDLD